MKYLLALLLSLNIYSCEAHRFRAVLEYQEDNKLVERIAHGTCFVLDNKVYTALHLLENKEKFFIEQENLGWIECELEKVNSKKDLAILTPKIKLKDCSSKSDGAWGSTWGKKISIIFLGNLLDYMGKHDKLNIVQGNSGAPIYFKGKISAMITGYLEHDSSYPTWVMLERK